VLCSPHTARSRGHVCPGTAAHPQAACWRVTAAPQNHQLLLPPLLRIAKGLLTGGCSNRMSPVCCATKQMTSSSCVAAESTAAAQLMLTCAAVCVTCQQLHPAQATNTCKHQHRQDVLNMPKLPHTTQSLQPCTASLQACHICKQTRKWSHGASTGIGCCIIKAVSCRTKGRWRT
jgi:hypothetical protein